MKAPLATNVETLSVALVTLTLAIDDADISVLERHAREELFPSMTDFLVYLLQIGIQAETDSGKHWEEPFYNPEDFDEDIPF